MKHRYFKEVREARERSGSPKPRIINENHMRHLPPMVQKYLHYCGVVGKEEAVNVRIRFEGRFRSGDGSWMRFTSEQYNFFDRPARIFYIRATKMGIPVTGLHLYKDQSATMEIRVAGLFKIADARGSKMDQGETVTFFNDMCVMAPSALVNANIQWEAIDPVTVKARYTNGPLSIGATLFFNGKGELNNFISYDRFETAEGKTFRNYPWATPVAEYRDFGGIRLGSFAKALWQRPDGDFCYGEFNLREIEYNC